ncbi:MAG: hypothetical protein D6689_22210 [Deltaproteobacteria bacterium]|nr:MAG: hypothetical protein D6689_22210 [Deltaproteobacteria bacterium]
MSHAATLAEQITTDPPRPQIVTECVDLIDAEVKSKGGLSGVALRTAYAGIKAIKPGFIKDVVDALLDDWVAQLEPYYAAWRNGGATSFADYLTARSDDVANELLKVTDERAAQTKHKTAAKYYRKMRDSAQKHVAAAVPKLAKLIDAHLSA